MTKDQVLGQLQSVFDDVFLDKVILTPQLTAKQVQEWDSLQHISLVVAVEESFSIRFAVGEVEKTKNIGEFSDLILSKVNG